LYIVYTEEAVAVLELFGLVGGEVGGQRAVGGASAALVLASGASIVRVALHRH
ncbi:unnamed protein product, partial [Musa acuminata subsp. malaccensis]